jgi:hypothetical protein
MFTAWMRGFHRSHFEERLHQLRLSYASHIDYFASRDAMNRPETQHAIRQVASAAAIKRILGPLAGRKVKTPVTAPIPTKTKAPANPLPETIIATMGEIARRRHGAIVHKELETVSKTETRIKKPYSDLQLLERALRIMAHRDVMAMHHDFSLVPVATFSALGLRLIEAGAPVDTSPSINP